MRRVSAVLALVFLSSGLALQGQQTASSIQIGAGYNFEGLVYNGNASLISGYAVQLTPASSQYQAGSVFYSLPVNIQKFTTDFTFLQQGPIADGLTFTIQNTGPNALGGDGAGLGYVGIHHSVALKFDLYDNDGEGPESTGVYTAGNLPTVPAVDLTGTGINLHYGHEMDAHVTYDGAVLTLTLTDLDTPAVWSHSFPVDIPAAVFGNTAYVGFTASTGYGTAWQLIYGWSYFPAPTLYVPNYPAGLDAGSLALNGSAALDGADLVLTNGGQYEAGSAFFTTPISVGVNGFETLFSFQIPESAGDGFTFTIQNTGPDALGGDGAGLGYVGIHHSVALKFGLYDHDGGGSNSVGVYTAGNLPDTPDFDLTSSGINLHSGHTFNAYVTAGGSELSLVLYDTVTKTFFSKSFPLDASIPSIVFGDTAYIGFTGGTGAATSNPTIKTWAACTGNCPTLNIVDNIL